MCEGVCVCMYVYVITWHADAGVVAYLVQTGCIILAGVWATLIHILLASWASISTCTLTSERAFCVYTHPTMLTRVWSWHTEINISATARNNKLQCMQTVASKLTTSKSTLPFIVIVTVVEVVACNSQLVNESAWNTSMVKTGKQVVLC